MSDRTTTADNGMKHVQTHAQSAKYASAKLRADTLSLRVRLITRLITRSPSTGINPALTTACDNRRMPLAHDVSLTQRIIGLAMRVHTLLGPGLLESVYERCLCCEFDRDEVAYVRQVDLLPPTMGFAWSAATARI